MQTRMPHGAGLKPAALIVQTALLILLMASSVLAQQPIPPSIGINVDRQPLIHGEPFTLTVNIETNSQKDPDIRLPRFGGLRVLRQSESHPMSFHFSFGFGQGRKSQSKRQSNYSFLLVADKPGKYKIDPVVVVLDGRKYQGDPYSLEILRAGASSQGNPGSKGQLQPAQPATPDPTLGSSNAPALDAAELVGAKIDPDFFIQTHLEKNQAVVGELLIMTIYLYTTRNISDLNVIREPGTEGFWVENLVQGQRKLTTKPVNIARKVYDRAVLRKVALFPIKPGTLTIAPTLVELEVSRGGFFSRRRTVKRSSLPVKVKVDQLPAQDQPAGFSPANVGRYTFNATLDRTKVKTGEPVTLTLTVRGEGNLRNIVMPEIKEIEGFKVYAPESDVDVKTRGNSVKGTRKSRVLMIPKDKGTYVVPEIAWSYFDTSSNTYKTLKNRAQTVTVHPGETRTGGGAAPSDKPAVTKSGQDRLNRQLRSILSRANVEVKSGLIMTRLWFLVLVICVPLIYLVLVLVSRTRRKMAEGYTKGRSKRADTKALRKLSSLSAQKELPSEVFFKELEDCLLGFLEDRLEVPVTGDTMAQIRTRLVDRGFSKEQAQEVATEMESLDFARFARSAGKDEERRLVIKRMEQLIQNLRSIKVTPPKKDKP